MLKTKNYTKTKQKIFKTKQKLLQLWLVQTTNQLVEFGITIETSDKTFTTLDVCWG